LIALIAGARAAGAVAAAALVGVARGALGDEGLVASETVLTLGSPVLGV
jgi:hypothetical protein